MSYLGPIAPADPPDGALLDTHEHMQTLTEARAKPHVLDDATIDRMERVYGEQRYFVEIYARATPALAR